MNQEEIERKLMEQIEEEESKILRIIVNPEYYKNAYLRKAFSENVSPICIQRAYARLLYGGEKYTRDVSDLLHANQIIERLKMIGDDSMLQYITDVLDTLKRRCSEKYPYIIMDVPGRLKSFKSFEAKIRTRLMNQKVFRRVLKEIETYQDFSDEDKKIAEKMMIEKLGKNVSTTAGDTFGVRIIIYSYNQCTAEEVLVKFIYQDFLPFLQEFLEEEGLEICNITDYIKFPKATTYQSLHIKVKVVDFMFEFQIRTGVMHYNAEKGPAAHSEYKDTQIQNFMRDFLYEISAEKALMNEGMGLLKEQTLRPTMWVLGFNREIPQSPLDLAPFSEQEQDLLLEIVKKSPLK